MTIQMPRITVRRLMIGVAVLAAVMGLAHELDEGLPPRFVIRGLPARIARLKPGMNEAEALETIGFGSPWWRGGLGHSEAMGHYGAGMLHWSLNIGPYPAVHLGSMAGPTVLTQYRAAIVLKFRSEGAFNSGPPPAASLISARCSIDGREVAVMPQPAVGE